MKKNKKYWIILFVVAAFITLFSFSSHKLPDHSKKDEASARKVYEWKIIRVVDGDTLEVAQNFLPPELKLFVRLKNVDTPEKSPRAKCDEEDKLAKKAFEFTKNAVEEAIKNNQEITFSELKWDKYGGRVLSDVKINNRSLAKDLINNGLGREYHGEKKQSWCKEI
jgi:endonuclease YncB( thermonuclease family)